MGQDQGFQANVLKTLRLFRECTRKGLSSIKTISRLLKLFVRPESGCEYSGMSLEGRELKSNMATVRVNQQLQQRMTKQEAAHRLAQLVEKSMDRKGLSEGKKNARVQSGIDYVDAVIASRANRAK
jgi:hypothetical protein